MTKIRVWFVMLCSLFGVRKWQLWPVLCLWCGTVPVHAVQEAAIISDSYPVDMMSALAAEGYVDASGTQSIERILRSADFQSWRQPVAEGFTDAAIWLRWRIDEPARWRNIWLQVRPTFLDEVTLFVVRNGQVQYERAAGDHVPVARRPLPLRDVVMPLPALEQPALLYVRIHTTSTLSATIQAWSPETYLTALAHENLLYGILFGVIVLAVLTSVFSGLWIRRPFFYLMAGYLVANGLAHMTLNGFDHILFYPNTPWWSDNLVGVASYSGMGFLAALMLSYWSTADSFPWLVRCIKGLVVLAGLGALISLLGFYALIASAFQWLALAIVAAIVWLGGKVFRYQKTAVLLMLSLFGPGLIALGVQVLRNLGVFPVTFWTTHLFALSTLLQVLMCVLVVLIQLKRDQQYYQLEVQRGEATRRFFNLMAHELRTPLAVIGSAFANVQLQTQERATELAPRFRRIEAALARLNGLIDNALAEERLSSGNLHIDPQPVLVADWLDDALAMFVCEPPHYLRIDTSASAAVCIDQHWMSLALLNLLDNAVKYSPEGGTIALTVSRQSGCVCICIEDEGIGFAPAHADQLFERFHREQNAHALAGVSGMGLGLFLVRQVVERHGGTVSAAARVPQGSCFELCLPLG